MSSSNSPPASSGTLNLTSSPTTSHNSIESINLNSKEQHLPPPTEVSHNPTSTSLPPTNSSSITDFASQQLPSLSTTHPFSAPTPPSPSLSASPTKPPFDKRASELAAREAKAHIRSLLREDWEWPPPSPQPECHALSWRERDHSDDDDTLPSSSSTTDDESCVGGGTDNSSTTTMTTTSRKRKRHATLLLQEELSQNEGLRLWHARRDCWAGAHHFPPSPTTLSTSTPPPPPALIKIPIPPPLIPPTHQIRSSITESTYPAIYSKVVVQGLSPTVPINLADMVGACVMGWKKDGEWPPKSAEDGEAAAAQQHSRGRGRRLARRGVGRVKRVLGLGEREG